MMLKFYRRAVTWSSVFIVCGLVLLFSGQKHWRTTTDAQQQQQQQQQQQHDIAMVSSAAWAPSSMSNRGSQPQLHLQQSVERALAPADVTIDYVTPPKLEEGVKADGFVSTETAAAAAVAAVSDAVNEQERSDDEKDGGTVDDTVSTTNQSSALGALGEVIQVREPENEPKWSESSSDIVADLSDARRHRVQLMKHCCKDYKYRRAIKKYGRQAFQQVLFSKKLKSAYCRLGKVSSSTWLRLLNTALGDTQPSHNRAGTHMRTFLSISPEHRRYFKFMFVRHPFDRLVSAFLDKFRWDQSVEYKQLAARIIRKYRPYDRPKQDLVQFHEFLQYVVDPSSQPLNDVHFEPQTVICQPCEVRYDFVGHYETLYDDGEYVIKKLGIEQLVAFPQTNPNKLRTWKDRVRTMFANVTLPLRAQLKNFYLQDFQMFGYDPII